MRPSLKVYSAISPAIRRLRTAFRRCGLIAVIGLTTGCGSMVHREEPSIAHIHIGHAITAWPTAPRRQGLLVAAELLSVSAAANAELMLEAARNGDAGRTRRHLRMIAAEVDPTLLDPDSDDYGLRRATAEAITHLKLASEVDDASPNVRRSIARASVKAQLIVDRVDELTAYIRTGLDSDDDRVLEVVAEEIVRTLTQVAGGPESTSGYGLYEFREAVDTMVEREEPPYSTVDNWYLFNLVQLPSGDWGFSSRSSRGAAGVGY